MVTSNPVENLVSTFTFFWFWNSMKWTLWPGIASRHLLGENFTVFLEMNALTCKIQRFHSEGCPCCDIWRSNGFPSGLACPFVSRSPHVWKMKPHVRHSTNALMVFWCPHRCIYPLRYDFALMSGAKCVLRSAFLLFAMWVLDESSFLGLCMEELGCHFSKIDEFMRSDSSWVGAIVWLWQLQGTVASWETFSSSNSKSISEFGMGCRPVSWHVYGSGRLSMEFPL